MESSQATSKVWTEHYEPDAEAPGQGTLTVSTKWGAKYVVRGVSAVYSAKQTMTTAASASDRCEIVFNFSDRIDGDLTIAQHGVCTNSSVSISVSGGVGGSVHSDVGYVEIKCGNVGGSVSTDAGDVVVNGHVSNGDARSKSGDVRVGEDVFGNVKSEAGNVTIGGDVSGNVSSAVGNIRIAGSATNSKKSGRK